MLQGPHIPLVDLGDRVADAVIHTFVSPHGGPASATVRPELKGLVDYNMVGSGLAALAAFESGPLKTGPFAPFARRNAGRLPGQLGIVGAGDIYVSDDRSADLGLALALFGAAARRDLGHVVATGSLRQPDQTAAALAGKGHIFRVGGMVRKCKLTADLIAARGLKALTFVYPAEDRANPELAAALGALAASARQAGCRLSILPADNLPETLRALGIDRAPRRLADYALAATVLFALILSGGGVWAYSYAHRPVTVTLADFPGLTGTIPTPAVLRDEATETYCLVGTDGGEPTAIQIGDRLTVHALTSAREPFWFGLAVIGTESPASVRAYTGTPGGSENTPLGQCLVTPYGEGYSILCNGEVTGQPEYMRLGIIAVGPWRGTDLSLGAAMQQAFTDFGGGAAGVEAAWSTLRSRVNGLAEFDVTTAAESPCTPLLGTEAVATANPISFDLTFEPLGPALVTATGAAGTANEVTLAAWRSALLEDWADDVAWSIAAAGAEGECGALMSARREEITTGLGSTNASSRLATANVIWIPAATCGDVLVLRASPLQTATPFCGFTVAISDPARPQTPDGDVMWLPQVTPFVELGTGQTARIAEDGPARPWRVLIVADAAGQLSIADGAVELSPGGFREASVLCGTEPLPDLTALQQGQASQERLRTLLEEATELAAASARDLGILNAAPPLFRARDGAVVLTAGGG